LKLIYKTETETLKELELPLDGMTSELEEELRNLFDDKPILKYEFIAKEGVTVSKFHRVGDLTEDHVSAVIVTLA